MSDLITPRVAAVSAALAARFPLLRKTVGARVDEFGPAWVERFEREIEVYFGSDQAAVERTVEGYGQFSIEAMMLQKRFTKTLSYAAMSYEEAVAEVYGNMDYMLGTYLPALLLSHYLWPHHYRQLLWVHDHFVPELRAVKAATFCDVGIGTGFYSKEILAAVPGIRGWGYDISDASILHTGRLLDRWGLSERYTLCRREVAAEVEGGFDAFVSVELLEHLESPPDFLAALRASVRVGAPGLITAALDAPNRDHIYLYRDMETVAAQLRGAGFAVVAEANFPAYIIQSNQETAPQAACFVVRAV
ncbi:MAG: class I SAM-dependent methyltransferase [Phaeospirillum sp.]|nr:class I SAM-dependent methyltransferase [Phaeospirillum sp.]